MPLKLTKRKGSPFWYVRGNIGGIAIFESTGSAEKKLADRYRVEREHQLQNAVDTADEKRLKDAIDAYIAKGGEGTHLGMIRDLLGNLFLQDVNQELVDTKAVEYFPTASNATRIRKFYGPISWVMNYAAKLAWCPYIKLEKPEVKRKAPKWAEESWFELVLPKCSQELEALLVFLSNTGSRVTEALELEWERVFLKLSEAYIPDTKTGIPRAVHLNEAVLEQLKGMMPENATGRIWHWNDYNGVNLAIRRAVAKVNKERASAKLPAVEYLSSHKVGSHTYATWMRRHAKLDQRGLVGTGRWKSINSTMVYTHTTASEESKKSDLLPKIGSGRAQSVHLTDKARKT